MSERVKLRLRLMFVLAASLLASGCSEIARIFLVPSVTSEEFVGVARQVCLEEAASVTAANRGARLEEAGYRARIAALWGDYRDTRALGGVVYAHGRRDLYIEIKSEALTVDVFDKSTLGRRQSRRLRSGRSDNCVIAADVSDHTNVLRDVSAIASLTSDFRPVYREDTLAHVATGTYKSREVGIEVLLPGEEVLPRSQFNFGTANDYRYTTLVVSFDR